MNLRELKCYKCGISGVRMYRIVSAPYLGKFHWCSQCRPAPKFGAPIIPCIPHVFTDKLAYGFEDRVPPDLVKTWHALPDNAVDQTVKTQEHDDA